MKAISVDTLPAALPSAVALRYDGSNAPQLTAKGEGAIADQIMEIARKYGIPFYEDPELAALLARLELGDQIPRTLYVAVAKVIAFTYLVNIAMTN